MEGVDEPSLQELPHSGDTATDLDVLVLRCLFREPKRLFDSAGDEVEGCATFHDEGFTLVVGEDEGGRVVGRIGTPPSLPRVVRPWATDGTEHVAAEDEGAKVFHGALSEGVVHISGSAF